MNSPQSDPRLARIVDIPCKPINASLLSSPIRPERRNVAARAALLHRICGEFDEMPGTSLTLAQAVRLFGISPEATIRILGELIAEGHVRQTINGLYRRHTSAA